MVHYLLLQKMTRPRFTILNATPGARWGSLAGNVASAGAFIAQAQSRRGGELTSSAVQEPVWSRFGAVWSGLEQLSRRPDLL